MKYLIFITSLIICLTSCDTTDNNKKSKKKINAKNNDVAYSFEYKKELFSYNDCDSKNKDCTYIELSYPQIHENETFVFDFLKGWIKGQVINTLLYNETVIDISSGVEAYFDYFNNFKQEMKEAGEPVNTWHLKSSVEVLHYNKDFFTLKTSKTSFETLEIPIKSINLSTLYLPTFNILTLEEMIVNESAFKKLVEKKFRKANNMSEEDDYEEKGYWFEEFELTNNVGIVENGLLMIYDYSEIASPEMGSTEILLPFEEIKGLIDINKAIQPPAS